MKCTDLPYKTLPVRMLEELWENDGRKPGGMINREDTSVLAPTNVIPQSGRVQHPK